MTFEDFLALFPKKRRVSGGFKVFCPVHESDCEGHDPSLVVHHREGRILLKCHAGCDNRDIVKALGIRFEDLFEDRGRTPYHQNQKVYVYTDAEGRYLFEKVRIWGKGADGKPEKTFRQQIALAGGKVEYDVRNVLGDRWDTLYRLTDLIASRELDTPVYICEGEKACDALAELANEGKAQAVATCQPGGAGPGKWKDVHSEFVRGREVIIVADRDEPGERYTEELLSKLKGVARSVRAVRSKTTNPHDDLFDHLHAGYDLAELVPADDLIPRRGLKTVNMALVAPEEPEFLWVPYLRRSQINILDAKGGTGKTAFCLALAAMGSIGIVPWGGKIKRFKTLYFGKEDSPGELRSILNRMGGNPADIEVYTQPLMLNDEGLSLVKDTIEDIGAELVVFDAITYYMPRLKNQFDGMEIEPVLSGLRRVMMETGACCLNVRHFGKSTLGKDVQNLGAGSEQWFSSHRSQLVMRPHPDEKGVVYVQHTKGSLMVETGEAFGFQRRGHEFLWVPPSEVDLSVFDPDRTTTQKDYKEGGRMDEAIQFVREHCTGKYISSAKLSELAERAGIAKKTLRSAKEAAGVKYTKSANDWLCHIPTVAQTIIDDIDSEGGKDPYGD